jgi:hypothetical protein
MSSKYKPFESLGMGNRDQRCIRAVHLPQSACVLLTDRCSGFNACKVRNTTDLVDNDPSMPNALEIADHTAVEEERRL